MLRSQRISSLTVEFSSLSFNKLNTTLELELHPAALSMNEIDPAGLPPDVVAILEASLHDRLSAAQWQIFVNNSARFGHAINPNRIPVETARIMRVDSVHMVDRNPKIPTLTSIDVS
ncbi:unnamed protein product [Brassica rapa]|uniref:Uncharacterized protein n=1 Tax=Brassica campestris TaxID=3711 RepID=A0A3P6AAU3_BRACM|nr:unnamed protein product [Brassica rapa]VDC81408.1 unnamed protein product [Brassica rapa]